MSVYRTIRRQLRRFFNGLREYYNLFIDGEAETEDYVLFVLLLTYGMILVMYVIPTM